jgi:hypothetical protein
MDGISCEFDIVTNTTALQSGFFRVGKRNKYLDFKIQACKINKLKPHVDALIRDHLVL